MTSDPLFPIHETDEYATSPILAEPAKSMLKFLPTPYGAINKEVLLATIKRNERITAEDHF